MEIKGLSPRRDRKLSMSDLVIEHLYGLNVLSYDRLTWEKFQKNMRKQSTQGIIFFTYAAYQVMWTFAMNISMILHLVFPLFSKLFKSQYAIKELKLVSKYIGILGVCSLTWFVDMFWCLVRTDRFPSMENLIHTTPHHSECQAAENLHSCHNQLCSFSACLVMILLCFCCL